MTVLKEYNNKNMGKFLSIPTKTYENGDVLDALYFSRYMKRLLTSTVEEVRSSEHYKNTMHKWTTALSDIDMNDFNSVESKLKLNINVFDPLKTEMQGGGVVKESYKTVELLKVGKDKYKPMLKVTGGAQPSRVFSQLPRPQSAQSIQRQQSAQSRIPRKGFSTFQEAEAVEAEEAEEARAAVEAEEARAAVEAEAEEAEAEVEAAQQHGYIYDNAIFQVIDNLQSVRTGSEFFIKNYKINGYYEKMPYLIFYDKSEFSSLSTKGGSDGDEDDEVNNEVGKVIAEAVDEAVVPDPDPDMISDIVNYIDENKKQFETDVKSSQEQLPIPIEDIEVKNIEVKTENNTIMNAKVLIKNGATLCIILQKTVKAISDITKLVLVNSVRLNLLYMKQTMKDRIDNKSIQLSSEEYDKIKLYAKTDDIDIEGIESIKNKKEEESNLAIELNNLIGALKNLKALKNNGTTSTESTTSSLQQQLTTLEKKLKDENIIDNDREKLEDEIITIKKQIKESESQKKESESQKKKSKSRKKGGGNGGIVSEDTEAAEIEITPDTEAAEIEITPDPGAQIELGIELKIAQIIARLKLYVYLEYDVDIVSCINFMIKFIFVVYLIFSIKRDIFSLLPANNKPTSMTTYKAPTVMTAYQVFENPTAYKAKPITLNSMIEAAMYEYDTYFTNEKYDPNTKEIMLATSDETIANIKLEQFETVRKGVENVRDLDAILQQYNYVQGIKGIYPIRTYNTTGIEELLMFRETVNNYAIDKHREAMTKFYGDFTQKSYATTKDSLVNECTIMMFKDIKFYFSEHVKAMFGTVSINGEPVMDFAFLIEQFMRKNERARNIISSVVTDLLTTYVGQKSAGEVDNLVQSLKHNPKLFENGIIQRFTLLEEKKKSFVNTPYTKSLMSFFEKPSPQNMMSELISSSIMGDRQLTANYFALSLLARILHTSSEYTDKLETTYKGLYSYEQYFGMLGMQCATKTYAQDMNKYFANIASV
tara:strand:+ start:1643 stop:4612 length:2970 start_codon:yes stop_codon:yes gene_type:complete